MVQLPGASQQEEAEPEGKSLCWIFRGGVEWGDHGDLGLGLAWCLQGVLPGWVGCVTWGGDVAGWRFFVEGDLRQDGGAGEDLSEVYTRHRSWGMSGAADPCGYQPAATLGLERCTVMIRA